MSSDDVIELGSSDEEAEPPPKKIKPMLNAMVHIPTILPGITIKSTNACKNKDIKSIPIKHVVKPNLTIKPNLIANPFVINKNISLTPVEKSGNTVVFRKEVNKHIQNKHKIAINPVSLVKCSAANQVKNVTQQKMFTKSIKIQGIQPKLLNNLPPSITITKAPKRKAINTASISGFSKKNFISKRSKLNDKEVLTVNLDDEEISEPSTANPQWYLRPDEEKFHTDEIKDDNNEEEMNQEQQNNKEPEPKKLVEIVIEDSPIKPIQNKDTNEIGRELPITIEDSPIKMKVKKSEDNNVKDFDFEVPQSKKRLNYPNDNVEPTREVVEIEIDPIESILAENTEIEVPKDKEQKEDVMENVIESDRQQKVEDEITSEFHPIYQTFIETCFHLENSEDMIKIVEKKIKTYYKQCSKEYVESEEFLDMVSSKIAAMKAGPTKMYLYIKDVVDELNLQRKMVKSTINKENIIADSNISDSNNIASEEDNEYDTKRLRQIRKLEKTIKKLHKAIQKLEEQEVDFDDEDDSVFLLTERYKERLVRVHAKFCQLTNTKMPSEPRVVIEARQGRPTGPAKKLEKFINKRVPIGTPLPFPDFHDVVRCVRDASDEDQLGWNDVDILEEARDLFARCGRKLQRRRQENEWRIATSRISTHTDPADNSEELKQKLNNNKTVAARKETELLNQFADKQKQLKLEAVEIGDKEAEESPIESEEEESPEDNSSLEDKEKRKERLKRLLQDKKKSNKKVIEIDATKSEKTAETEEKESDKDKMEVDSEVKNLEDNDNRLQDTNFNKSNDGETSTIETTNNNGDCLNNDIIETVNNSNDIESDIDELHLLQKLHSENELNTSSSESSDSDSPIAISDTLESDSDNENINKPCDIISIENSSYSESEVGTEVDNEKLSLIQETEDENLEKLIKDNLEIEFSAKERIEIAKTNEDSMENILLASSEEDKCQSSPERDANLDDDQESYINLKDDTISISETILDPNLDDDNETCVNLKDDNISISETIIGVENDKENNKATAEELKQADSDDIDVIEKSCENVLNENVPPSVVITDKFENEPANIILEKGNNVESCTNVLNENVPPSVVTLNNVENEPANPILNKEHNEAMELECTSACIEQNVQSVNEVLDTTHGET